MIEGVARCGGLAKMLDRVEGLPPRRAPLAISASRALLSRSRKSWLAEARGVLSPVLGSPSVAESESVLRGFGGEASKCSLSSPLCGGGGRLSTWLRP